MNKLAFLLILSFCMGYCKTDKKEPNFDKETYEKVKETLADKEKNNPAKFLMVYSHHRKNLIGQTVVIGSFSNFATICTYKDIEIRLSFFSKTGVKLDEGLETIYENIDPGKTVKFKTKYFTPKGTDSVAIKVTKATGEVKN